MKFLNLALCLGVALCASARASSEGAAARFIGTNGGHELAFAPEAPEPLNPPTLPPEAFFPNCSYLDQIEVNNIQLDRLWYITRPVEVLERNLPGGKKMLKIHMYFGMGACEERGYSRFTPSRSRFVPHNAWEMETDGRLKNPPNYAQKAYTNLVIADNPVLKHEQVIQAVASLNVDKDALVTDLKTHKTSKMEAQFTMNGLHDGFYYNHLKFIKLIYHFELKVDGKIYITLDVK